MSRANGNESGDTVLIGYDGSDESANAIARAGELLGGRRAVVVSVWSGLSSLMLHGPLSTPRSGPLAEGVDMIDEPERERAERRAAKGASLARAAGFDAQPLALKETRNVWHTIRGHALENEVAVVVVGARGRSRLATVLLGGVSSGLMHHAPAPLLVVPATADMPSPGPLVFCDDGSDHARRAIERGRRLLHGSGVVLSLWRPWTVNAPYMAVGAGMVGVAEDVDLQARKRARAVSAEGAELASALGGDCAHEAIRFDGPAWRGLIEAANNRHAAAIVVGSRGISGIAGTLGSVAAALVHHSPRPVLVVPPADSTAGRRS